MPKLIGNGHKLGSNGSELLRNRGSECCCNGGELAYQYSECCDGFPRIWVAARAFLPRSGPCDLIRVGQDRDGNPICFNRNGAEATLEELDRAEIRYITEFTAGDGCGPGPCGTGIALEFCRRCPVECCIRGYPPSCNEGPRECCVLGSAIEVTHNYRSVSTISGLVHAITGNTPEGIGIMAGYSANPIYETVTEYFINAVMVRYNNSGKPCVDVAPRCYSRSRTFRRAFMSDGWRYTNTEGGFIRPSTEVIPINPRYEIVTDITDEGPCFEPPIYPEVGYGYIDPPNPERSACRVNWERLACYGNAGPGCPGPGNPWWFREALHIDGFLSCTAGRQNYRYEIQNKATPNDYPAGWTNPHPSGENVRTETVLQTVEYTVRSLSRENCEARTCEDIGAGPGDTGGILPRLGGGRETISGGSGCTSCRNGPGL